MGLRQERRALMVAELDSSTAVKGFVLYGMVGIQGFCTSDVTAWEVSIQRMSVQCFTAVALAGRLLLLWR